MNIKNKEMKIATEQKGQAKKFGKAKPNTIKHHHHHDHQKR